VVAVSLEYEEELMSIRAAIEEFELNLRAQKLGNQGVDFDKDEKPKRTLWKRSCNSNPTHSCGQVKFQGCKKRCKITKRILCAIRVQNPLLCGNITFINYPTFTLF
jgi:hypothetical protein